MFWARVLVAVEQGFGVKLEEVAIHRQDLTDKPKRFAEMKHFKEWVLKRTWEEGFNMKDVHIEWQERDKNGKIIPQ